MTHPPYWKLYRIAPRAISVVETHGPSEPAIQSYSSTLIPAANAMMEAFSRYRTFAGARAIELAEGKASAAHLLSRIRAWTSVVDKSLDGFDVKAFGARPDVPEDVIHDAQDLIRLVEEKGEATAHFLEELNADLTAGIEATRKEWSEATATGTEQVTLQRDLKAAAVAFHKELVAFRRTLAAILGRNHRDYRRLRASTVKSEGEDEVELDTDVSDETDGAVEPAAGVTPVKKEDGEAAAE